MTAAAPRPSVTPSSVVLAAPGGTIVTTLEVVNRGGGQLEAFLESSEPWLEIEPRTINGNQTRVTVTVDVASLGEGEESAGRITLRAGALALEVPVRVTRAGLPRAYALYREGKTREARRLARGVEQSAATALLIALTLMDEKNPAGARKPLLEAAAALSQARDQGDGLDPDFPPDVFKLLIAEVESALPHLRDAHFGVELFESLLDNGIAARMEAEAAVLDLLHTAAALYADQFPPVMLGPADLIASSELIGRMKSRFPDDPRWDGWLAMVVHSAPVEEQMAASGASRGPGNTLVLGIVVAVVIAGLVLLLWPRLHLKEARVLLSAGRFEEAMRAVDESVQAGVLDTSEARQLRAEINFGWARTLFQSGSQRMGAERLTLALHESHDSAEMIGYKRTAYHDWAVSALARGKILEAFEALSELSHMSPPEPGAAEAVKKMEPLWRLCNLLGELASVNVARASASKNSPSLPLDLAAMPDARAWRKQFSAGGLVWYNLRLQVSTVVLEEDGVQLVAIAGNSKDGQAGVHIYAPDGTTLAHPPGRLREVLAVPFADRSVLEKMQTVHLDRSTRRTGLVVDFSGPQPPLGHGVLVYSDRGKLKTWSPPDSVTSIRVSDADQGPAPLLWASVAVGDGADPKVATRVPIPYKWPTFASIAVEQDEYYNRTFLPQLRKELAANPYPAGDPRHQQYVASREKAAAMVADMLKKK